MLSVCQPLKTLLRHKSVIDLNPFSLCLLMENHSQAARSGPLLPLLQELLKVSSSGQSRKDAPVSSTITSCHASRGLLSWPTPRRSSSAARGPLPLLLPLLLLLPCERCSSIRASINGRWRSTAQARPATARNAALSCSMWRGTAGVVTNGAGDETP